MKAIFRKNLFAEEHICDKMSKMCINEVNFKIQYDKTVLKCIWNYSRYFTFLYKFVLKLQTSIYFSAEIFLQKDLRTSVDAYFL